MAAKIGMGLLAGAALLLVGFEVADEPEEDHGEDEDDDEAQPDPPLLGHEQPGRVEQEGAPGEPAEASMPPVARLSRQPLIDGVCGEPEVDDRPDRERRYGGGEEGRVRGEVSARTLLDPGAELFCFTFG